jgi:CheY-like chemotaxis protein
MRPVSPDILFIDDNEDSCELLAMMLSTDGGEYKTTTTASPFEALSLISEKDFDLLVVDYQLPGMTGVELCRRVRENDKQTPILFFTGMAHPSDRDVAMAAGATSYLVKPNDLDKFTDTVKQLINEKC